MPGRKIVEVRGTQKEMWQILFKSRIAEDLQVRISHPFLARGEEELEKNLGAVPWHCYLPDPKVQT